MRRRAAQPCSNTKASTLLWATSVLGNAVFPDVRLARRGVRILTQCLSRPGDSIARAAGSPAAAKATYRFLENPRVNPSQIWGPLHEATAKALADHEWVFAIQDTTVLMYPTLAATTGLGTMNTVKQEALQMHSTLALRPDGQLIGLLATDVWARPPEELGKAKTRHARAIEDKESFKWLAAARYAGDLRDRTSPATRLVHVVDREGDIHEFMQEIIDRGDGAIIRNRHDRRVEGPHLSVWTHLEAQPVIHRMRLEVPRTPEHPKRWADLEIRASEVTLRPSKSYRGRRPLELGVVWVHEPNPPAGVERLDWMLWTTMPITTVAECLAVAEGYRLRWRIEEFHRVLKDGMKIEDSQLKTAGRIETLLAFCSGVAARLLQVTYWARIAPQALCTEVLAVDEWHTLWAWVHKSPPSPTQPPPTMREAVRLLGRLGGHLGRKCDGMPGVRSLWKGWRDLQLLVEYHQIVRSHGPPP